MLLVLSSSPIPNRVTLRLSSARDNGRCLEEQQLAAKAEQVGYPLNTGTNAR